MANLLAILVLHPHFRVSLHPPCYIHHIAPLDTIHTWHPTPQSPIPWSSQIFEMTPNLPKQIKFILCKKPCFHVCDHFQNFHETKPEPDLVQKTCRH